MSPIARLPAGRRILLGVALAGMLGAASLATTAAATTSTIAVAPEATAGLGVGDTFTIRVVVTATEAVSGAQATVTFDPSVVQLRSYSRGPEWAQAPLQIAGTDIPKANQLGVLQAVASAFFPPDGVAAGTSDFLVLDFQVVACGSTWLGLPVGGSVNASLLGGTPDDYGVALPLASAGGNVTACPGSTPAPSPAPTGSVRPTPSPTPTQSPTPPRSAPPLPAAAGWVVRDLGGLGPYGSTATAINAGGQVVGRSPLPSGDAHAFLWDRGRMIDLGTLGGNWSSAEAVNDRGEVFGRSLTRDGAMHAFLWSDGRMSDLGAFDVYAGAGGVNRGGIAVGTNWDQAVVVVGGRAAALPSLGGVCQAVAINDRGVVTGSCDLKGWSHAVVWTRR